MAEKVCLVFDFNVWDEFVAYNYERFKFASAGLCDFIPAFHKNGTSAPDLGGDKICEFTNEDVFGRIKHSKDGSENVVPGNCDLSYLAICRKNPGYDKYIRVEYDVFSVSGPKVALKKIIDCVRGVDLGGSFFNQDTDTDWMWWKSLGVPENVSFDREIATVRAFFPIMSVSRKFINVYERALADGWKGHFEVLAPTIAAHFQMSTLDFASVEPKLTSYPQFQAHRPEELGPGVCCYAHPVKTMRGVFEVLASCRPGA